MKIVTVNIRSERKRYEELLTAMMNRTEYEGGFIMQYSEYQEGTERYGKFILGNDE